MHVNKAKHNFIYLVFKQLMRIYILEPNYRITEGVPLFKKIVRTLKGVEKHDP